MLPASEIQEREFQDKMGNRMADGSDDTLDEARATEGLPTWNWREYVPPTWPPPDRVVPQLPTVDAKSFTAEDREAYHAVRRNFLRAERERGPPLKLDAVETKAAYIKRAKKGKDRLGLRKISRKKKHKKMFRQKRSGCFISLAEIAKSGSAGKKLTEGPAADRREDQEDRDFWDDLDYCETTTTTKR
ncbi:hypothetical protein CCR75_004343 [Bremia lactucae]|uniref:Uncharacterized protein n=1 Tax=Bremia lactucae TaxID=4779 RepID=A0A976IDI7_BRELC|nr:hypothetical protein CCR75_004343 [Bremia lactucae]